MTLRIPRECLKVDVDFCQQSTSILSRLSDSVKCRRILYFQAHALYLGLRTCK